MSRPADWSPLAGSDPVPGDPAQIQVTSRRHAALADELASQASQLRTLAGDECWDADAYLLADLRYGLPLAASCLATITPYQLPDDVPAEALALTLAQDGDRTGTVVVEGRACATLVRRTPARLTPEQASGMEDAGDLFSTTRMDAYLPFPDGGRMLLLSYSTPVEPVAEQLVRLFEAMTGSLRWRWE